MSGTTKSVFQAALALSPDERAALAEQLLSSLHEDEEKLDALWAAEAEQRLQAYRQGKIKAIPAEQVFSKLLPESDS
jgi:putative addiction module component (TIGR02574 family)